MKLTSVGGGVLVALGTLFAIGFVMVGVLPRVLGEKVEPPYAQFVIVNKTSEDLVIEAPGKPGFTHLVAP